MTPISTVLTRTAIRLARQTLRRSLATHVTPTVTLHVPRGSTVFQYGHSSRNGGRARPLLALPAQAWTIEQDERWAVVGAGKDRQILLDLLLSHHRIAPPIPSPGRHPFLYSSQAQSPSSSISSSDPVSAPNPILHLTFSLPPSPTGEFSDYTARYHSLQESDRLTLLQTILWLLDPDPLHGGKKGETEARWATRLVGIEHLLDVPFVGLSNGQTRRARLALALLKKPKLLIVEEPFAGLDPEGRKEVAKVLGDLTRGLTGIDATRVVLILRGGEDLPGWITDVVEVQPAGSVGDTQALTGPGLRFGKNGDEKRWWAEKLEQAEEDATLSSGDGNGAGEADGHLNGGKEVVRMEDVNVSYGDKQVLHSLSWSIRTGDRWHLQGHNGSGKTTLLSLLLGDHPRSFSLPSSTLTLFSLPRRQIATTTLQQRTGHTSPEIYKAFPRRGEGGMSVEESVGTGYEGIFSRRKLEGDRKREVREVLARLLPAEVAKPVGEQGEWAEKTKFAALAPGQQSLVLFARAVVGAGPPFGEGGRADGSSRKELIILDEPFNSMEPDQIARCRRELRRLGSSVAVVWVGHWEGERPWGPEEPGAKFIKLEAGRVVDRSPQS